MKIRQFELVPRFELLKCSCTGQWMQRQLNHCWMNIFESACSGTISEEFDVLRIAEEYGFDVLWHGYEME